MRRGGGEGGDIHREGEGVLLIFEAIGNLHIDLSSPLAWLVISRGSVHLVWQD